MPYVPGAVPFDHSAALLDAEFRRVAEAVNVKEALGGLALNSDQTPGGVPQTILPAPAQICNAFDFIVPTVLVGDGPVLTDPDPVANDIGVQLDGIYILNYYLSFTHELGTEIIFEIFNNGTGIGLGSIVDASQQTSASSTSGTGILSLGDGNTIDLRVLTPSVSEDVVWNNGAMIILKLRDLRTRFS